MEKICRNCNQAKPLSEFYSASDGKHGVMARCKVCIDSQNAEYRAANPDAARLTRLKGHVRRVYGLSWDRYLDLFTRQNGRCGICARTFTLGQAKGLVVDHDHKTNRVRGLLCQRCNSSLGQFGDDLIGIRRAIDYLSRPPGARP